MLLILRWKPEINGVKFKSQSKLSHFVLNRILCKRIMQIFFQYIIWAISFKIRICFLNEKQNRKEEYGLWHLHQTEFDNVKKQTKQNNYSIPSCDRHSIVAGY